MIFRKKAILLLVLAISLTGMQAAFADVSTSSTVGTGSNDTTTSSTYGATATTSTYDSGNSGLLAQIDALYTHLIDLRKQDTDLEAAMKDQNNKNNADLKALRSSEKADDIQKIKDIDTQNKAIRDANKDLLDQYKSLAQQLKQGKAPKGTKNKDEKGNTELRLQLNELKGKVQAVEAQIKANNETIKATKHNVEAARMQYKAVLAPIKAIELQMKQQWSEIKGLEQQKEAAWKTFNAAVKAGDANSAVAALTQIVALKQSILDDKQKVYDDIKQVASAISGASTGTTPVTS
jgi:chromosome segregation ATPase